MKPCKACLKEIHEKAYRCSFCGGFQNWYRNPQITLALFLIPILLFMVLEVADPNSRKYISYRNLFSVEQVKVVTSDDNKLDAITYKVNNKTKYKWQSIKYKVMGTDDKDDLVFTKSDVIWGWVVQPKAEAYLTVIVERKWKAKSWDIEITDLASSGY
ncbi:MAG: hypothetical protein IIA63_11745 [Nitrospinae bacterium]|nr:hypothetical protein [Nitrospinota bacterium]